MHISIVDKSKAEEITKLVTCLLNEIMERTGVHHFEVNTPLTVDLCEKFIEKEQYHVMAVFDRNRIVAFGALCESYSLYAEGVFGILQELYVMEEYRSQNIGGQLMKKIVEYAKSRNWKRLELCTPPVPEFARTVDFYKANGFEITGGYKMRRILD
jgi:GNAT superfamily N-acetyltransferase